MKFTYEPRTFSAQEIADKFRSCEPMPLRYVPVVDYNSVIAEMCLRLKEAEEILRPFGGYDGYEQVNHYFAKYEKENNLSLGNDVKKEIIEFLERCMNLTASAVELKRHELLKKLR